MKKALPPRKPVAGGVLGALLLAVVPFNTASRGAPPVARAPFAWTPGQIEVAVHVNGAPATFLLDTGAEYSVVSTRLATQAGLAVDAAAGRQFADDVTLQLKAVVLMHHRVMVMPFDTYYERGRRIDGLLGYDLFARFVVAIDFKHQTLTIWEPSAFKPRGAAVSVPIEFAGRLALIPAVLKLTAARSLPARLMLDTGASQAVILRYPFATEHNLLDPSAAPTVANSLASGPRRLLEVPMEQISVAKWTFDRPRVQAYAEPIGSGASVESDGLLGNSLLSRFTLYVDYPHRRLLFEPTAR